MDGVLNKRTNTVHRRETDGRELQTLCGATSHLSEEQLRKVAVEQAATDANASRCGRCFVDAGGY